jgi:hypothetical protein
LTIFAFANQNDNLNLDKLVFSVEKERKSSCFI